MSYKDGLGLLMDGGNVISTLNQSENSVTAAPKGMSIIDTILCDLQYEALAQALGTEPALITEEQLFTALNLVDLREQQ